ncbi:rhomboid family intramembrane serine protease, partial [Paludibacteraceae bacterium OttesenSCG-928-F17]|nr:rhomboid family intramembrane serine protease [Paludibacteraceae bacterium OttesenSCG-928-F17]
NMFALFMFGSLIERTWGTKRFLLYYFVTGIGAGIVQQVVWTIELRPVINAFNDAISTGSAEGLLAYFRIPSNLDVLTLIQLKQNFLNNFVTIGASGAVFGLLLAYGMMFPNSEVFIMFIPIPIKAKYFVVIYGVIELFLGVSGRADSVAHFAHLGGMLFGILLILYWKKKGQFYN